MGYFHPEEEHQVWTLYGYERDHPGTSYLVEFDDAEAYVCQFDAAYDSENGGELEIDDENPLYDEFAQAALEITESKGSGLRGYQGSLLLDYRDWPARITDIGTGTVVYPEEPT